jgi:hypothetical protein
LVIYLWSRCFNWAQGYLLQSKQKGAPALSSHALMLQIEQWFAFWDPSTLQPMQ